MREEGKQRQPGHMGRHDKTSSRPQRGLVFLAVALGLLLSRHALPARPREPRVQHPRLGVVLLAPVEDETGSGRFAVLAMTLNPRVRIVAGSLRLVRVGTQERRPIAVTVTHFHEPPYAMGGWLEASCLVPGRYVLQATMRGAQGEVDTATLPVTIQAGTRTGRTTCWVTEIVGPRPGWDATRAHAHAPPAADTSRAVCGNPTSKV
jgi:hypothetical protein